jgi:hypothetical protein
MLRTGWCKYWTKIYCLEYSSSLLYYLSGLSQPLHSGHEACTVSSCTAHDVSDWQSYKTRHVEYCTCNKIDDSEFLSPKVEEITSIIEAGRILLVKLTRNSLGVFNVDIIEYKFGCLFTAILYMWSGGLGNLWQNTLPSCQLESIYNSIRLCRQQPYYDFFELFGISNPIFLSAKYPGECFYSWFLNRFSELLQGGTFERSSSQYVWIDTLCIPTGRDVQNLKDLKEKAIDKMVYIYAAAQYVLVLDQTLEKVLFSDTTDTTIAVQFATCPWIGRCWTFQEAALAHEFLFVLNDQVINPWRWGFFCSTINNPLDRSETDLDRLFKRDFLDAIENIPDVINNSLKGRDENDKFMFKEIWAQLAKWSTTKREDLYGIIAVTKGLSTREIFNSQGYQYCCTERRMLTILRAQKSLPLSMLYFPYSEDTPICKDYAWVPYFPSGELMFSYRSMIWKRDGQGLAFIPSETASIIFTLLSSQHYCGEDLFCITIKPPTGDRNDNISVLVELRRSVQNVIDPTGPGKCFCLVIYSFSSKIQGCNAIFLLKDETLSELYLSFLSLIDWLYFKPSPASAKGSMSEYSIYISTQGTKYVLDYSKSISFLQWIQSVQVIPAKLNKQEIELLFLLCISVNRSF